tara:strand:+ start:32 stop:490 length:459 start_codon:yes stop_codon:yes gene_type:complete
MIRKLLVFIKRIRIFLSWLWQQEGTPAQRARGIAVGVFSGCFPLFGFQTILGVWLASFFRGNHLLAVTGTWISNPFTYVPLYWFNYKVGTSILGVSTNINDINLLPKDQLWQQGWSFSSRILLGSTLVGLTLSSFVGLLVFIFLNQSSNFRK